MQMQSEFSPKGLIITGVIAVLILAVVSIAISFAIFPALINPLTKKFLDTDIDPSVKAPGDLRAYDPIAHYDDVLAFAGDDVKFLEMQATFVRSDGTMDLKSKLRPTPNATYEFIQKVLPTEELPIGAGVGVDGYQWQTVKVTVGYPGQRTTVRTIGGKMNMSYSYINRGMKKDLGSPVGSFDEERAQPKPVCSFKDLWNKAIERGAPKEAVAVIDFENGRYGFTIRDTDFRMEFDPECRAVSFKGDELSIRGNVIESLNSVRAEELVTEWLAKQNVIVKTNGLPPQRFSSTWDSDGDNYYVAWQILGSGVPGVLSARCFRVEGDGYITEIGTYTRSPDEPYTASIDPKTCRSN
ncbi:hypothetical protein KBC59_03745 [Patescibacteria group bacterium]|nr:hypothetical protein [Patescibacteria group bacterium]